MAPLSVTGGSRRHLTGREEMCPKSLKDGDVLPIKDA
jgi:hypothetical protein